MSLSIDGGSSSGGAMKGGADLWRRVVERLYISPFCEEFRRPVRVLHPDLIPEYRLVVQSPMDLGSVLYKIQRGEYAAAQDCSADIALIFRNSIQFNEGSIEMTSISSHLLQYAKNMWEEIVRAPFDAIAAPRGGTDFRDQRIRSRAKRFAVVRDAALCLGEINDIIGVFSTDMKSDCPALASILATQLELLRQHGQLEQKRLDTRTQNVFGGGEAMEVDEEGDATSRDAMTLSQLLRPIAEYVLDLLKRGQSGVGGAEVLSTTCPCIFEEVQALCGTATPMNHALPRDVMSYLSELDDRLGEAVVHIFERRTRGYILSAVWARPHRFVWAQPSKSPWWPGMVIAGDSVPGIVSDINLSRLPPGIVKALEKLRPRVAVKGEAAGEEASGASSTTSKPADSASSSSTTISIPPNYCLVEFFGGSHDFGWVKAGFMTEFVPDVPFKPPIGPDGLPLMQTSVSAGGSRRDATKCTTDSKAIREATEARDSIAASTAFPNDFIEVPSLEELEIDFLTPEPEPVEVAEQPAAHTVSKPKRTTSKQPQNKANPDADGDSGVTPSAPSRSSNKRKAAVVAAEREEVEPWDTLPPSVLRKRRSMQQAHFLAVYLRSHDPCGEVSCPQSMEPPLPLSGVVPPGLPGYDPASYRDTVTAIERAATGVADAEEAEKVACYRYFEIDSGVDKASKSTPSAKRSAPAKRVTASAEVSAEAGEGGAPAAKKSRTSAAAVVKAEAAEAEDLAGSALASQGGADAPNAKNMRISWRNVTALRVATEGHLRNPYRAGAQRNYHGALSVVGYELKNSCTRLLFGEGVCQTRIVDETADIFFMESKSSAVRKRLMQAEIERLHREVDKIMSTVGAIGGTAAQRGKLDSLQTIGKKGK